jgi:hypothetical protein
MLLPANGNFSPGHGAFQQQPTLGRGIPHHTQASILMETTDMALHVDFEQRIPHGLEAPGQKGDCSAPAYPDQRGNG